jgi:acetophenone carboxylase
MQIHPYLELDIDSETIACLNCDSTLCSADENYREHVALRTGPITEAGPGFIPVSEKLGEDRDIEFREFFCPDCGVLLQSDFAKSDDPILYDIELDIESLSPK